MSICKIMKNLIKMELCELFSMLFTSKNSFLPQKRHFMSKNKAQNALFEISHFGLLLKNITIISYSVFFITLFTTSV